MSEVNVSIDRDECTLCAVCWETCPDFFEANPEDGMTQVVEKYRKGDSLSDGSAPESLRSCITEAAENCPVEIIHVK